MITNREKSTIDAIATILDRSFNNKAFDIDPANIASSVHVLVVKGRETQEVYFLPNNRYTIGRNNDNDIQILSKGVSRYHATLYKRKGTFWIIDGSTNGTPSTNGLLINQKACKSSKIKSGDTISFCSDSYAVFFEIELVHKNLNSLVNSPDKALSPNKALNSAFVTAKNQNESDGIENFLSVIPELIIKFDSSGVIKNIKESKDNVFSAYGKSLIEASIFSCFSPYISKRISLAMGAARMTGNAQAFDCEIDANNQKTSCEVEVSMENKDVFFAVFRNIQSRKHIENKLLHDALHDNLTGLPNRSFFIKKADLLIQKRRHNKKHAFALLFVDIDKFKIINDSLGHLIGDEFIVHISKRLKKCLRPQDIIARFGGDEFTILINDVSSTDEAILITRRLQTALAKPIKLEGHELMPSASIGIVLSNECYTNVNDMLRDADLAMYQAKAGGRSRFEIFDQEMHQKVVNFIKLESDLRQALRRNEFKLFYQPIVCLKTQKLVGFEALIRWFNPDRGLVNPTEFISQAEETGLIVPLGEWALKEGCRQLDNWHQIAGVDPDLTLNINLSSKQFSSANLTQHIADLLEVFSINPKNLKLEITESIIMENSQFSIDVFHRLRKLGVQICIDDFGTGYSSLSYLHRFPIDALKIDRSFVSAMDDAAQNTGFAIAQSVVGLAHNLGVKVVAEGIENARHLVWLRSFQCDYGQGYFFAKPLNAEKATALVKGEMEWSYIQNAPSRLPS
ncbi:GGDEF domain-containing protein [filamentous cyanobacterium CCP3]|nr:GGDEF domain-containing protein [filamentous cyanobacterium CCP3]